MVSGLMSKINKSIIVLRTSIPELSSMKQKSCDAIVAILGLHYSDVDSVVVNSLQDLKDVVARKPDLVFLGLKHLLVKDESNKDITKKVWVSKYLDEFGINYVGSGSDAIKLDYDKPASKKVVLKSGLKTPSYFVANKDQYSDAKSLPISLPLFVKPPSTGSGEGIGPESVVRTFESFKKQVLYVNDNFNTDAMVETYLTGREFSVAVFESSVAGMLISMPIELVTEENNNGDRILGKVVKNEDNESVIEVKDGTIKDAVKKLAEQVFVSLNARDYGRIDIRLDSNNIPHFLEANLVPGFAHTGYFCRAWKMNQNLNYEEMVLYAIELGLRRNGVTVVDDNYDAKILSLAAEAALLPTSSKNVAISASKYNQITLYKG